MTVMTKLLRRASLILSVLILMALFGACNKQQGTKPSNSGNPTEKIVDIKTDLNQANLKNAGGSLYEDGDTIYYVNKNYDLYKFNSITSEKALVLDLNSNYTGFLNVQGDDIYFIYSEKTDQAENSVISAYVVKKDGSGLKKLFDKTKNLRVIDNYAYYLGQADSMLNRFDLQTGQNQTILDNAVINYDIAGEMIYYVESADPAKYIDLSIKEFNMYTKEKKVLLSSVGMDPAKQATATMGGMQYYNGSLYYFENISIRKYDLSTGKAETIAVDPITLYSRILGLFVTPKGIYFYSNLSNLTTRVFDSYLYNADAGVNQIIQYKQGIITYVNLTNKYIIVDVMDMTLKERVIKTFDYKGMEVTLDW